MRLQDPAARDDTPEPKKPFTVARDGFSLNCAVACKGGACVGGGRRGLVGRGRMRGFGHDAMSMAGVGSEDAVITGMSVLGANHARRCFCHGSVEPITAGPGATVKR